MNKENIRFYPVVALKRFYKNGEITKEEYNSLVTPKHQIKTPQSGCEIFGCHYFNRDNGHCRYEGENCPHRKEVTMTELQTLIKENASLIRQLKYSVKEKQGVIEILFELLFREGEKVLELVEALEMAIKMLQAANCTAVILNPLEKALAKVEGK